MADLFQFDLDVLVSQISKVLSPRDEIIVAYLYGSMVKGQKGIGRDIDLALLLDSEFDEPAMYSVHIAGMVEEELVVYDVVDVRVLNHQSLGFQFRVIKEGLVVYCRDERERVGYEARVVSNYLDVKPFLDQYDAFRLRRLGVEG